jgi:RNA polymerase sigma-70 factor, ECF subfamily
MFFRACDYKTVWPADYLWSNFTCEDRFREVSAVGSRSRIEAPPQVERAVAMGFPGGETADFATLLRRHQTQLFSYIYSLVRDLDDADDLFQQTSIVLWDKFDVFDPSKSFIGWACGVARYEVLNFVRSRGRNRLYFTDELNLALIEAQEQLEHEPHEDRRDALSGCMKKLRERDLELLETCYGRSVCIQEVARTRGRSTHSVHNSLRRIRRLLFECVRRSLARGEMA